jgi:putative ABC transport system ATP-binding protein
LIASPGLLLADEPTGNLDTANGEEIIKLLLALNADHGTTMVIATRDSSIAARCGRMVNMRDGHIVTNTSVRRSLQSSS